MDNKENIITNYVEATKNTCLCVSISIFLILLFIMSPLNRILITSVIGKICILILLIYSIYILVNSTFFITKKFDINILENLESNHQYWNKRNVSNNILVEFKGGIAKAGKMKNRYVFPIFDINNNIIGFSGRDITNLSKIKWKHLGEKNDFLYPLFLNSEIIQNQREIILVESIGDMLSLWQAGVKNVLVTFGTNLSLSILNYCLKIDAKKIYISLNNDSNKNSAGNIGAEKTHSRLKRYFDEKQLQIALPTKKDFGEMSEEEIFQWKTNL